MAEIKLRGVTKRFPDGTEAVKQMVEEALPDLYVTSSVDILPEIREYERTHKNRVSVLKATERELSMARQLIEAQATEFDPGTRLAMVQRLQRLPPGLRAPPQRSHPRELARRPLPAGRHPRTACCSRTRRRMPGGRQGRRRDSPRRCRCGCRQCHGP